MWRISMIAIAASATIHGYSKTGCYMFWRVSIAAAAVQMYLCCVRGGYEHGAAENSPIVLGPWMEVKHWHCQTDLKRSMLTPLTDVA